MKWHNEMIYENTLTESDVIYLVFVSIILEDPRFLGSHKCPRPQIHCNAVTLSCLWSK